MRAEMSMSPFRSKRCPQQFRLFCVATFLAHLTFSTVAYFSVTVAWSGMSEDQIGSVLSSPLIPVTLAILLSGRLLVHFPPLSVALLGQLISLVAFVSLRS